MKHLFIRYETGIPTLAKEKGFDEPCLAGYLPNGEFCEPDNELNVFRNRNRSGGEISAPLYQQIVDWFREKHNIDLWANPYMTKNKMGDYHLPDESYSFFLFKDGVMITDGVDFLEYYDALNRAIEEAFKLIPVSKEPLGSELK
jgi:hypothetical protein